MKLQDIGYNPNLFKLSYKPGASYHIYHTCHSSAESIIVSRESYFFDSVSDDNSDYMQIQSFSTKSPVMTAVITLVMCEAVVSCVKG